jgi:hypothetical protein
MFLDFEIKSQRWLSSKVAAGQCSEHSMMLSLNLTMLRHRFEDSTTSGSRLMT